MKPAGSNYKPNPAAAAQRAAAAAAQNAAAQTASAAMQPEDAGDAQNALDASAARGDHDGHAQRKTAGDGAGRKYIASRVMSASPMELIVILYDQLFELIADIKHNIARKSPASVEPDAERAQAIVDELINSLDYSVDISRDLGAIYFYVRDRMMMANIKFDASIWEHAEDTLRPLRDAFVEAAKQSGGASAANIDGASPTLVAGMTYGHGSLSEVVMNAKDGLKA